MSSPTAPSTYWTSISPTGVSGINALLEGTKWGTGAPGTAISLSYSFPQPGSAVFDPHYQPGVFDAGLWPGLNATQQGDAVRALQAWANVANITFTPVTETATDVGDIRIAFSQELGATTAGYTVDFPGAAPDAGDVALASPVSNPGLNPPYDGYNEMIDPAPGS